MKNIRYLLFAILLLSLFSCVKHAPHNPTILQAGQLIYSAPDSSRSLLLSIPHPERLPETERAAWCLYYVHAMYRLEKEGSLPDSLIHIALKYYDNTSLYPYSGTANYLAGCLTELKGNRHQALLYYKKALKLLENTNEYDVRGLDVLKIVYLYSEQNIIQEAKEYAFSAHYAISNFRGIKAI